MDKSIQSAIGAVFAKCRELTELTGRPFAPDRRLGLCRCSTRRSGCPRQESLQQSAPHPPLHPRFDRFPRTKTHTSDESATVDADIANERREKHGFRCNTTETAGPEAHAPMRDEGTVGAEGLEPPTSSL